MSAAFLRVLMLSVCLLVPSAAQVTIRVPADRSTIQSAIDASVAGDTILVAPGTYFENIVFNGKNVTLKSEQGPQVTIIDGGGVNTVVQFKNGETRAARLEGFTIRNGFADIPDPSFGEGGGIWIYQSSPTIIGNVITSNLSCWSGGGIHAETSSSLIQGNTISNNRQIGCSGGRGGGISLDFATGTEVVGNLIEGNEHGSGGGIGIMTSGDAIIRNNVIRMNSAGYGAGISIGNMVREVITQNLVYGNIAVNDGSALDGSASPGMLISSNTFVGAGTTTAIRASGGWRDARYFNNIIVASPGELAVECHSINTVPLVPAHNLIYSDVTPLSPTCPTTIGVNNNQSSNPRFSDPVAHDYRLRADSPAIDRGANTAPLILSEDIEGTVRLFDGDNNGVPTIDVGVYEFVSTAVDIVPSSLTFQRQALYSQSQPQLVTITNRGTEKLRIVSITQPADFTASTNCVGTVNPNGSCTVTVTSLPSHRGVLTQQITLVGNVTGGQLTLQLQGEGAGAQAAFTPPSLQFPSTEVGSTTAPQMVSVRNIGEAPMEIASLTTTSDYVAESDCPGTLGIDATCFLTVRFRPLSRGAKSSAITIQSNAAASPQQVPLTGTGVAPNVSFLPQSASFPGQIYGTSSTPQTIFVISDGDSPLHITSIASSTGFSHTHDCPAVLESGGFCSVSVSFQPTARSVVTGALTIQTNTPNSPSQIPLSGEGIAGKLVPSANPVIFARQALETTSSEQLVTLRNQGGNALLTFLGMQITGDFSFTTSCGATLSAVRQSCVLRIKFSPTASGVRTGKLTIQTNSPESPVEINLEGEGFGLFTLQPSTVDFGDLLTGTSISRNVVLSAFESPLNISQISTSEGFTQVNQCPPTLNPGFTCTIRVSFTPTQASNSTGSLSVIHSAAPNPSQVSLRGNGVAAYPPPVVTGSSPSAIEAGSGARTITISGTGFFAASVAQWNGQPRETTFVSNNEIRFVVLEEDVATLGAPNVRVVTPTPGGGESASVPIAIYRVLALDASALNHDPSTRTILATSTSSASLMAIDPESLSIVRSLSLGGSPYGIAISESGNTAYISNQEQNPVQKVDLTRWLVTLQHTLGGDQVDDFTAENIHVLPGSEDSIAVARMIPYSSPRHKGIAIFDNGIVRPQATPSGTGSNEFAFGPDPTMVLGFNSETTEFGLRKMRIGDNGISLEATYTNLGLGGFGAKMVSDRSHFFTSIGKVFAEDGTTLLYTTPTQFTDEPLVFAQTYPKRYSLIGRSNSTTKILVHDTATFASLGTVDFPFLLSRDAATLWGRDGIAINANFGQDKKLVIARSLLWDPGDGVTNEATIESLTPSSMPAASANTTVEVAGTGFVPGMKAFFDGRELTTTVMSQGLMRVLVPAEELASPGQRSLTLTARDVSTVLAFKTFEVTGSATEFSEPSASLGLQLVGRASDERLVTLRNNGRLPLSFSSMVVDGEFAARHQCQTIQAGESCSFYVMFVPMSPGAKTGRLTVMMNGNPASISLSAHAFDVTVLSQRSSRGLRSASPNPSVNIVGAAQQDFDVSCSMESGGRCFLTLQLISNGFSIQALATDRSSRAAKVTLRAGRQKWDFPVTTSPTSTHKKAMRLSSRDPVIDARREEP